MCDSYFLGSYHFNLHFYHHILLYVYAWLCLMRGKPDNGKWLCHASPGPLWTVVITRAATSKLENDTIPLHALMILHHTQQSAQDMTHTHEDSLCIFHLSPFHLNNIFDYFFSDFFSKPHKRISVCEGLYLLQSKQNLILNGNNLDYNIVAPIRRLVLLLYNLGKGQDLVENASWGFKKSHLSDVSGLLLILINFGLANQKTPFWLFDLKSNSVLQNKLSNLKCS